jgi:hypothetical protein
MAEKAMRGDRSAFDVENYPEKHASDIDDGAALYHLPAPGTVGNIPIDDGTNWTPRKLVDADIPNPYTLKAPSILTISSGSITPTKNNHIVAAESGTTDDLTTIVVGTPTPYQLLLLKADAGDTITVKTDVDNIKLDSGADFVLTGDKLLLLYCDGTDWFDISSSSAGGSSSLTVEEEDADPTVASVTKIKVSNGRLTDLGSNEVLITIPESTTVPGWTLNVDGVLAVATDVAAYIVPGNAEITSVQIRCKTKGTSSSTIIDVHRIDFETSVDSTIFTTQANRPTLAYNDADGIAESGTPDIITLTKGDLLLVHIDQVAPGAADLTVVVGITWLGATAGGGVNIFRELTDVPSSFADKAGQTLQVNQAESALEFTGEYLYLMTFHNKTDNIAYLAGSINGTNWKMFDPYPIMRPSSGNQRDPTMIYHDGYYWVCHTNDTNTYFSVIFSSTLLGFALAADVDMTDIASVYRVWAPSWFIDPADGSVHIFVCCSTSSSTSNFQIYEVHPTNEMMTTWSTPVAITITGVSNCIDPFMVYKGGTYYLWYKEETADYIQYASSATLTGTYTNVETGNWASWGSPMENPSLVLLPDGTTWRIYFQEHSGFNPVAVWYSESTDDWANWGAKAEIQYPWVFGGQSALITYSMKVQHDVLKLMAMTPLKQGAILRRTTAQSISNNTTTAISWESALIDKIYSWSSGTKVYAMYPGWYHVAAHVKFAAASGGKRTIDIRVGGTTYYGSHSHGTTDGNTGPDISTGFDIFFEPGTYVEITVYHDYGSSINVEAAEISLVQI